MSYLPLPIVVFFLLTVLVGLFALGRAVRGSAVFLAVVIGWMAVQSGIALRGFYLVTTAVPPHLALAVVPPLIGIAVLFATGAGRRFVDGMELKWTILLHTVRVLVEMNLYWLFLYKQVPVLMTFEGGNLDILSGLSAPAIWWAWRTGRVGRRGLLIWNGLALLGVLNAMGRAMLFFSRRGGCSTLRSISRRWRCCTFRLCCCLGFLCRRWCSATWRSFGRRRWGMWLGVGRAGLLDALQRQRRNTGISPLRFASVEMTSVWARFREASIVL